MNYEKEKRRIKRKTVDKGVRELGIWRAW